MSNRHHNSDPLGGRRSGAVVSYPHEVTLVALGRRGLGTCPDGICPLGGVSRGEETQGTQSPGAGGGLVTRSRG